jgi:hypothetical protein
MIEKRVDMIDLAKTNQWWKFTTARLWFERKKKAITEGLGAYFN